MPNVRLVGRDAELALLDAVLAQPGRGHLVEVVGEPGIGKSSLLDEWVGRAGSRIRLAQGRATAATRDIPLALVADALHCCLPSGREELVRRGRALGPGRLHASVGAAVAAALAEGPLLLVLDDLHWGDEASLDVLGALLRRPPGDGLTVAVAYRHRQAPLRLHAVLAGADRSVVRHRVDLGPLSAADTARLLERLGSAGSSDRLHELSGGNPFYLLSLAAAGPGSGRPGTDADLRPLPVDLLSDELTGLAPATLQVARAAAVCGEPVDPALVAAVAGGSAAATDEALDELERRDVLRADGPAYRFRHPLLQSLVYDACPPRWRDYAHRSAAAELAARGASASVQAPHLVQGGMDDPVTVRTLAEAAAEQLLIAPTTAAGWAAAAAQLAAPASREHLELRWLEVRGLASAGELAGARRRAVALMAALDGEVPPGDVTRGDVTRGDVAMLAAELDIADGRTAEAVELLRDEVGDGPVDAGRADVAVALACALQFVGEFRTSQQLADQAHAAATRPDVALHARSALAGAAYFLGEPLAPGQLGELADEMDALPDREVATDLYLVDEVAWIELYFEQYGHAARHFRRAIDLGLRCGHRFLLSRMLCGAAQSATWLGSLAEARASAEEAAAYAHILGSDSARLAAAARLAHVTAWSGDVAAAAAVAEEVHELEAARGRPHLPTTPVLPVAHIRLLLGDPRGCVDELTAAYGESLTALVAPVRLVTFDTLVRAWLDLGEPERADAAVAAATEAARLAGGSLAGYAALSAARVGLARGDAGAASAAARRAADRFAANGLRVPWAEALLLAGQASIAAGEPDVAAAALAEAKQLADACAARPLYGAVVRAQSRAGASRPRPAERDRLTKREREIAELIAAGLRNRQIAERLQISRKTVETHQGRIFAKLAVTSRAALISRLAERSPG